jgi:sulfur carrier protein
MVTPTGQMTARNIQQGEKMIQVSINGKPKQLKANSTIQEMLEALGYDNQWLGVAINTTFISKTEHRETIIQEGDQIDILSPIQGG